MSLYKVFECDCRYWVRSAVDTLGPVPVAATNISRTVFNPANVTQGEALDETVDSIR